MKGCLNERNQINKFHLHFRIHCNNYKQLYEDTTSAFLTDVVHWCVHHSKDVLIFN